MLTFCFQGLFFIPSSNALEVLKGRIETIFVDGNVKVPEELQATAEKFDIRLLEEKKKPRILSAQLKTFPAKLRGDWKGTLKMTNFNVNPSSTFPVSYEERSFMESQPSALAQFRFYTPSANVVTMAPPIVKFISNPIGGRVKNIFLPLIDPSTGQPPRGRRMATLDGKYSVDYQMIFNKVRMLSNDRVEQDLIVMVFLTDRNTREKLIQLEEHIYEFKRLGSFRMSVKMGEVHYDDQGGWILKTLYTGMVR